MDIDTLDLPETPDTILDEGTQEPEQKPAVSSYENTAREMGWRPKEEWEGDPEKWREAKEFVERGELYSKIDTMGRELKETKKALKMLHDHNQKIKETEYNRAVSELKELQKKHLVDGNPDAYLETTELLTDLKAEQKARQVYEETAPKSTGVDPRFIAWVGENKWYEKDGEMREYADIIGQGYAAKHPGIDPVEVLKHVTKEVKARFRESFQNPNRDRPTNVEGAQRSAGKTKVSFDLTDDERRVMNTFIRTGAMTKEEYIEQVKSMRGTK